MIFKRQNLCLLVDDIRVKHNYVKELPHYKVG